MQSMRSLSITLVEIWCLQSFDHLTSGDPKWPLTSTKNNSNHLHNMANSHDKYEIPPVILLEMWCLQGFDHLASGDPKWPLTSTKNKRDHLLNMATPHAKYNIPHIYSSWDIVFTSIFQDFHYLTSGDPKWTLTSTKNNRDHLLDMGSPHAKYEIPQTYSSGDIVFTRFWPFYLWWPQMTFDLHQK